MKDSSGTVFRTMLWLLAAALAPLNLAADAGAYRIEVLVFRHAGSAAVALETEELRHFAEALRLDTPRPALMPEDPVALSVMSDMMQSVWRRLGASAEYEPLHFLAWEQSRIDYHPPIRVHDDEIIARRLRFPGGLAFVDLRTEDMFSAYVAPYFRLDGTVQMRRTRFLHLDLDLEYRVELIPVAAPLPLSAAAARERAGLDDRQAESPLLPARVHSLRQSRQIRTGALQYFDTPYLGVLARVTATSGE